MFLERFSLPLFLDREVEDLNNFQKFYDNVDSLNDKRVNKIKRKKEIISSTFEILSGLFDLKYDLKLKFDSLEDTDDFIYIDNIENMKYSEIFKNLFDKCCRYYLNNISLYPNKVIDDNIYQIVSLSLLNNQDKILSDLTTVIYDELINNKPFDQSFSRVRSDIKYSDLKELPIKNALRNEKLKEEIMGYEISDDLSYNQLKTIYSCFSNNVFSSFDKASKIHLMNLLYNYHTYNDLYNFKGQYKESMTNKDALTLIINKLMMPGRTMIIKRKNMDIINDVLSGKTIIYKNEIDRKYVNILDDLNELVNNNVR